MKKIISSILVLSVLLWLIGLPLTSKAFTFSDISNNATGKELDISPGTKDVEVLDITLPAPNTDTLKRIGAAQAVAAGNILTEFSNSFYFYASSSAADLNDYDDGEAIFKDDGDGQLEASSSDSIITAGGADFTKIAANIAATGTDATTNDICLTKDVVADNLWQWGETIFINADGAANCGWATGTDIILATGTATILDPEVTAATTVDSTLDDRGFNIGFLDSNHDGQLDYQTYAYDNPGITGTATASEPLIRTANANESNGYQIGTNANDAILAAASSTPVANGRHIAGDWAESWSRMNSITNLRFYDADAGGTNDYDDQEDIVKDDDASGYYQGDKLESIIVNNAGTATNYDINNIKVLVGGTEVGSATAWGSTISTSTDPGVYTGSSGNRIYVKVDVYDNAVGFRTIKAQVPVGGIQLVSTNDGPTDLKITGHTFTILGPSTVIDDTPPVSAITAPSEGQTLTAGEDYTISGYSTDSGGSTVKEVKISLDGGSSWNIATALTVYDNGFTWQYVWQNPAVGNYTIKARAEDHWGNTETPGAGISVQVVEAVAEEVVEEAVEEEVVEEVPAAEEVVEEVPVVEEAVEKVALTIEELQAKIAEILEKIAELRVQLIQLLEQKIFELQSKISQLKAQL